MRHVILAITIFVVSAASASTLACEPAPDHTTTVTESSAPDCLEISSGFSYGSGTLDIQNNCAEPATLEGLECGGCGDLVEVAPDAGMTFTLESRRLEDGQSSTSVLGWSVGEETGTLTARTDYSDNSDACSTAGCSTGSGGTPDGGIIAVFVGLALMVARRRAAL